MSAMIIEKNGRTSISSRTKQIEIRYFFIQDRIKKGEIGLEYCHTDKMVVEFMKNPLQGKKVFKLRNHIMGMTNGENISEVQKLRDEIGQNKYFQNGQTARGIEKKNSNSKVTVLCQHEPNPKECVGKVKSFGNIIR